MNGLSSSDKARHLTPTFPLALGPDALLGGERRLLRGESVCSKFNLVRTSLLKQVVEPGNAIVAPAPAATCCPALRETREQVLRLPDLNRAVGATDHLIDPMRTRCLAPLEFLSLNKPDWSGMRGKDPNTCHEADWTSLALVETRLLAVFAVRIRDV